MFFYWELNGSFQDTAYEKRNGVINDCRKSVPEMFSDRYIRMLMRNLQSADSKLHLKGMTLKLNCETSSLT